MSSPRGVRWSPLRTVPQPPSASPELVGPGGLQEAESRGTRVSLGSLGGRYSWGRAALRSLSWQGPVRGLAWWGHRGPLRALSQHPASLPCLWNGDRLLRVPPLPRAAQTGCASCPRRWGQPQPSLSGPLVLGSFLAQLPRPWGKPFSQHLLLSRPLQIPTCFRASSRHLVEVGRSGGGCSSRPALRGLLGVTLG